MKTLKFFLLMVVLTTGEVLANNLPPVADIDISPGRTWFYTGELITFDGSGSYDQDESGNSITSYYWYVKIGSGSYVLKSSGGSTNDEFQECFEAGGTAYATTGNGCLALGSNTTVKIRLKVYDDEGSHDYGYTATLTIKAPSARRYFITDHLGSVRATVDEDGEVMGADDYYPFGLAMPGRSANSANPNDKYKYITEELDREAGLSVMNLNARLFDPLTARFMQIDPMHDLYPSFNPYHYAFNNPMLWIDPSGLCPEDGSEGDAGDGDGHCLPEITVTASPLYTSMRVTIRYTRPNYLASFGAFAARTSATTQADGIFPIADAFYGGLLLGKIGVLAYQAATFEGEESFIVNAGAGDATIDDLLEGAVPGSQTKGKSKIYEKEGGMEQADEDFDSLGASNVKPIPNGGRTGTLPNGDKVNVRNHSDDGRPTIEVQKPNGRRIKIRYN